MLECCFCGDNSKKKKASAGPRRARESRKVLSLSSSRSSAAGIDYFDNIFKRFSSIRIGNKSENKGDTSSRASVIQTRSDVKNRVPRSRISRSSSASSYSSRGVNSPPREAVKKGKKGSKNTRRTRRPRGSEDNVEDGEAGISVRHAIDADELIRAYDRTYIQLYPDERLRQVVDSHEHMRSWHYDLPATSSYRPRTSHELQWLDVHGQAPTSPPKKTAPSSSSPSTHRKRVDKYSASEKATPDLHKAYLVQRDSVIVPPANKPTDSGTGRESLLQMASSGSHQPSQVSPARKEIMRMLYDVQDPTVDGVRRSSRK